VSVFQAGSEPRPAGPGERPVPLSLGHANIWAAPASVPQTKLQTRQ
jgi:hypothetical protein